MNSDVRAREGESPVSEDGQVPAREPDATENNDLRQESRSLNGRNGKGQFVKGNPGGPGNPFGARIAALKGAVLDAVTAEDIERVIKTLVDAATDGDVAAAKVLLDRLFGKEVIATVEHVGGGATAAVLILPSNGTEAGSRART